MEALPRELMNRGFLIYQYETDPPLSSAMPRPKFVLKKVRTPADNRPFDLGDGDDELIEYFATFDEALDKAKEMIDWKVVEIEVDVKQEVKKVANKQITYFDNGDDKESLENVCRVEVAGYNVHFIPTSGPPALWVDGYEVVGRTAIRNMVENLIHKGGRSHLWMMQLMYRHIGFGPKFIDLGKNEAEGHDDAITKATKLAEAHIAEFLNEDDIEGWDVRVRPYHKNK